MIPTVTASSTSAMSVQDILAEADKASSEVRKDAKITRKIHHQKNMALLDQNIGKLKEQQSQLGKAGWFNFFIGMISNFLNIATAAISMAVPPLAPVVNLVNQGLQGILNGLMQINPFSKKAGKAGVAAEEFKKLAQNEETKFGMEDERVKQMAESNQIFKNRMEKAIENIQKSQEAAVRV